MCLHTAADGCLLGYISCAHCPPLCVCAQLRQTAEFVSAHGGRVCWDESTLSFALAVDEQLDRVKEEVRGAQD